MRQWTGWEVVRRQVAVCGRVLDADGRPTAQARVTLERAPDEAPGGRRPARRAGPGAAGRAPADPASTLHDGCFYFLDLPAGRYVAVATEPAGRMRGRAAFSVSYRDGTVERAGVDIRMAPRDVPDAQGAPAAPTPPDGPGTGAVARART